MWEGGVCFTKVSMNENEEAKRLGIIHILLQLQVEKTW